MYQQHIFFLTTSITVLTPALANLQKLQELILDESVEYTVPPLEKIVSDPILLLDRSAKATALAGYLSFFFRYRVTFNQKSHWTKDDKKTACSNCDENFTNTKRRHHCRLCGDVSTIFYFSLILMAIL